MLATMTYAQTWHSLSKSEPSRVQTTLISSSEDQIVVKLQIPGFYEDKVTTPRGEASVISVPHTVSTFKAGEPALPVYGIPTVIGDKANMKVYVKDMKYTDYEDMEIAPSKGDFPRTIDPATVPYTYGETYGKDEFFPSIQVGLYEPYIIRDLRGQNMITYPFAYNPVTKTLRVYHEMTLVMYKSGNGGANQIETRRSNVVKLDPDFKSLYSRHFINFEESMSKYTPLDEEGDLLIICYDSFISSMTDFVNWKKTRGVKTTIVGTSTAGTSYSAIKTYIQNQYNANNNLTHVLLVGDVAQIPGYTYSGGGSSYAGKGDNAYGQIVGNDIYNDLFIGRFSAQNANQVTTQTQRVITYERDLTTSDTWLQKADGVSRKEGGSGHNGEDDYQHMDIIRTDLLNYGYTTVYQDYENLSGYTGTASSISSHINGGVGTVNYTNHGDVQMWGVAYYSNSNVNALTNENKLPFIWSVACLVGKYDNTSTSNGSGTTVGQTNDCFAEAWMHATNSAKTKPTGAIGVLMSYISQPWIPPMWGHDECVDILVDSYSNNIKHTWGGTSINGIMGIFDHYGTSDQSAVGTYQAWILYGDPSMMLRTKTPQAMTVTHDCLDESATSFTVSVNNGDGAMVCLTNDYEIVARATVTNGSATLNFTPIGSNHGTMRLCVFGFNKVTYLTELCTVSGGASEYTINVSANPTNGGTVTGGGTYDAGTTRTVTATANTGYTFTNWTENGSVVSTNASYSFTLNYNRNLIANFAVKSYTVNAEANPTEGGSVALAQGGKSNKATLTYDFEDGTQGWTTLKGNTGNSPNNWMHSSEYPTSNNDFSSGYGHNNSDGFMLSESYISGSSNGSGSAVTPDNYLVSPQVTLGGSISFYAGARNTSYCAEKFSVMVSTTNNTSTASFTTVETFTLSLSSAGYTSSPYTVDLSAYSGMGYIAIRHFDCYDQWFIQIDDVTIEEGEYVDPSTASETFTHGQTCVATATPNTGYHFVNWTENGSTVSSNATYSFTVTANRNLVANFSNQTQSYTVSVSANPTAGGTVTGGGTYTQGQSCTVVASPNTNYTFTNWTENGSVVSTNATYTFNVTTNRNLVANFTYQTQSYTVNVSANPTAGGTVTGGGTYTQGQSCTVVASPNTNYTFNNWTENGTVVSTNASYTFNVSANRTLVANFTYTPPTYTVTLNTGTGGTITPSGTQAVSDGGSLTFTVTPNTCYAIANVTVNGTAVTLNANNSYTITNIHGNQTVNVTFTPNIESEEFNVTECDSYTWHGTTYIEGGTYTFNTTTAAGCDRIETLNLTLNYSSTLVTTVTTCEDQPYEWHGQTYAETGEYSVVGTTEEGCTWTQILDLTVNHNEIVDPVTVTACENYEWHGMTYTTSGTYIDETPLIGGCVMIETLILTINQPENNEYTVSSCTPYTWNGQTYSTSGVYTYDGSTSEGCDLHEVLNLTINSVITNDIYETACESYTWTDGSGQTYTESGEYEYSFSTSTCDSTVILHLNIGTGTANVTISMEEGDDAGVFVLTAEGAETYVWSTGETTASITVAPEQTTTYTVTGTDAFGCEGTAEQIVYVDGIGETASQISLFPNPVKNIVTVKADNIERVRLFDITGQLLIDTNENGETVTIDMSKLAVGQYVMQVSTQNNVVTEKLIKR